MEKITLQNNFSWQDVLNFCEPGYNFGSNILERCSLFKSKTSKNIDGFANALQGMFLKVLPDFDFDGAVINYMAEVRTDENGKNNLYIDSQYFLTAILILLSNTDLEKYDLNFLKSSNEKLKDDVVGVLIANKKDLTQYINQLSDKPNVTLGLDPNTKERLSLDKARDILVTKRKKTAWVLKHLDELFNVLNTPIDLSVLNEFDKDKFLLLALSYSLKNANILNNKNPDLYNKNSLYVLNDYILLTDYIKSEGNENYNSSFSANISNGNILISTSTIENQFNKFCKDNSDYARSCEFPTSYEELLAKKASESFKTINNKKLVANIKLNWEMIPSGSKVKLSNYNGKAKRVVTTGRVDPLKLKKAYDLLDDKIEYFKNSGYLFELSGINTFEGYQAYMYSNGVVVFEKFFKNVLGKGKQIKLVPVTGEAIYAMNFREFADLSKYSKTELIQEMVDFNNTDVDRINHTSNGSWKNRVNKIINGSGYGGLDLDVVNDLSKDLVKKI